MQTSVAANQQLRCVVSVRVSCCLRATMCEMSVCVCAHLCLTGGAQADVTSSASRGVCSSWGSSPAGIFASWAPWMWKITASQCYCGGRSQTLPLLSSYSHLTLPLSHSSLPFSLSFSPSPFLPPSLLLSLPPPSVRRWISL